MAVKDEDNPLITPLTDREKAILLGRDPDEVEQQEVPDGPQGQAEESPDADSGDATDGELDGTEAAPESDAWITDDVRRRAAGYGLSDDELKGFGDADAFRSAGVIADRLLAASSQQPPPQQPPPQPEPEKKEPEEEKPPPLGPVELLDVKPFEEADYDAPTLAAMKAQNRLGESLNETMRRMQAMEERLATADATAVEEREAYTQYLHQQELNKFHEVVDGWKDERFGSGRNFSRDQDGAREQVWNMMSGIQMGLANQAQATGRAPDLLEVDVLAGRARDGLGFSKPPAPSKKAAVEQQTGRRRQAGRSKSAPVQKPRKDGEPPTHEEEVSKLASRPEVEKYCEEHGVR